MTGEFSFDVKVRILIAALKGVGFLRPRLDALEEKLKSLETQFIRIDGKTPQQRRPELVEKFQTQDVQVAAWCVLLFFLNVQILQNAHPG